MLRTRHLLVGLAVLALLAGGACGGKQAGPDDQSALPDPETAAVSSSRQSGGADDYGRPAATGDDAAVKSVPIDQAEARPQTESAEPPEAEPAWMRARRLIREGKVAQAEQEILAMLDQDPNSAMAWHLAALTWAAREDYARAMDAFDRAMFQTAPNDLAFLKQKARVLKESGKTAEAVLVFEEALKQSPDDPQMQNSMAVLILEQDGDLKRAEGLAQGAAKAQPEVAAYWETLGMVQEKRGRHVEAVISFHRLIKLEPDSPRARKLLLQSLEQLSPDTVSRLVDGGRLKR